MSLHIDLVVGRVCVCVFGGGPSVLVGVVTGSLSHGSQPLVNTPPTTLWSPLSAVTGGPIDLGADERPML